MLILCEYCDIRCVCYDDWMEHLLSNRHQEIISDAINNWSADLNERSLVISINGACKPEKQDICWYFANYGLVSDAFFETDLEFCVIQLDKKEYADHAMTAKHYMQNATLSLRLKADITNAEWLILNSMVRRKGSKKPVSKGKPASFEGRHQKLVESLKFIPVDAQLEHFRNVVTMKSEEVELRQKLLTEMKEIFRKDFPKCFLCPYGSFVTGLGSNTSVLHIYFDAPGHSMQYGRLPENKLSMKKEILENFKKCVENINRVEFFCCDFIAQPNDPIPYVKFSHHDTGVKCKFTFDSLLPVEATKMLNFILKLDPRLFDVCKFIRYWGEYHKLTGPHLISNYSLVLLLVVFLTKKRVVPSISVLQSMSSSTMEINGWDASYCTDANKVLNLMSFIGTPAYSTDPKTGKPTAHSILELASEFFKLYAHSDLQSVVICPLIGELLPRSMFEPGKESELPKTLETYKNWASVRKPEKRFDSSSLLCIQDPFDLGCNVSKVAPESVVWNFQFLCAETVENMQKILSSSDAKLMEIFRPLSSTKTAQSIFEEEDEEEQTPSVQPKKSPTPRTPTKEHVVFNYDSVSQVPIPVKKENNHDFSTKTTQSITQQIPGHSEESRNSKAKTEQPYWNQYSMPQSQTTPPVPATSYHQPHAPIPVTTYNQQQSTPPITSYHPPQSTPPVTSYHPQQSTPPATSYHQPPTASHVTSYYQDSQPAATSYHPPQPPMVPSPSYHSQQPPMAPSPSYNPPPPAMAPSASYHQPPPPEKPSLLPSPTYHQPPPHPVFHQPPTQPTYDYQQQYEQRFFNPYSNPPGTFPTPGQTPALIVPPPPAPEKSRPSPVPKPVPSPVIHRTLTPVSKSSDPKPVPPPVTTTNTKWLKNSFSSPTKSDSTKSSSVTVAAVKTVKGNSETKTSTPVEERKPPPEVVEAPKIITRPLSPLKSESKPPVKKETPKVSTSAPPPPAIKEKEQPAVSGSDSTAQNKPNSKTITINILSNQPSVSKASEELPAPRKVKRKINAPTHTLMFGSIEKILRIIPDDAFVRLFKENLGNLVSDASTNLRMNVLWCMFLKEFFAEVWETSFEFSYAEISSSKIVQSKKRNTIEEDLQYHQMVCNTLPEDDSKAAEPKKPKLDEKATPSSSMIVRKLPPIKFAFTPQSNPYKQKFFELNVKFSYEQGYFCYMYTDFYVGRSKLRSHLLSDDELSAQFPNPLEWEGEITRRDKKDKIKAGSNVHKCALAIKIEFEVTDKSTRMVLTMRDVRVDAKPSGVMNNLIQHIISIFRSLIPAYQLFRLKKWLGINTNIVVPVTAASAVR